MALLGTADFVPIPRGSGPSLGEMVGPALTAPAYLGQGREDTSSSPTSGPTTIAGIDHAVNVLHRGAGCGNPARPVPPDRSTRLSPHSITHTHRLGLNTSPKVFLPVPAPPLDSRYRCDNKHHPNGCVVLIRKPWPGLAPPSPQARIPSTPDHPH